ncbi:MAG: LacI family DNA-binding transcriptional regulator [Verrucomicrobiota bacterium]
MATLKDIAGELNVSTALVSKVLNDRMGNTGVSDRTRRAIMAKAQELDYRPHPLAVALKAGKRGAIGVFLHPFGEPGAGLTEALLAGIADRLNQHDQRMWLTFYQTDRQFLHFCSHTVGHYVDGLLVAGPVAPHPCRPDSPHPEERGAGRLGRFRSAQPAHSKRFQR